MLALLGALLWVPWRVLDGAPLAELSGDQDFQLFLHKNLEFTRKIKGDVAALQSVVVSPGCRSGGDGGRGRCGVADKVTFPSPALSARRGREAAVFPASQPPAVLLSPGVLGHPWGL